MSFTSTKSVNFLLLSRIIVGRFVILFAFVKLSVFKLELRAFVGQARERNPRCYPLFHAQD